jgi:hypothetical protein
VGKFVGVLVRVRVSGIVDPLVRAWRPRPTTAKAS